MGGILLLTASQESWSVARQQTPMVIGLPALPIPSSLVMARNCGMFPGAIFVAVCRRVTVFRARVIGEPFLDDSPIFRDGVYPVRVPFEILHELGERWYTRRDSRDILQHLFVGTLYWLPAEAGDSAAVRMSAFSANPANANQRLIF